MKKGIKIFLVSIIGITTLVAGSLYYISTKLSPDEIKQLVIKGVERALPNSSLSIAQVSYGLGPSISFQIDQFDLKLKTNEPGANLFSVDKVFVKVPIWAIFNGGGEINVSLNSPNINYYEYQTNLHNWQKASGNEQPVQKTGNKNKNSKEEQPKTKSTSLALPAFLAASKINLRMDNVNLFYQTKSDLKGEYQIRKFLVKNLSLDSSAAFEIQSQLKMQQEGSNLLSSELLLIGEVETSKLIKEGKLVSKIELQLKNFQSDKVPYQIPNISSSILLSNENNIPKLSIKSALGDLGSFYSEILVDKMVNVDKLNLELKLSNVLQTLGQRIEGLNTGDAILKVAGSIVLKNNKPIANIKFNTLGGPVVMIRETIRSELALYGSLIGQNLRSEIDVKGSSGKAELFVKTTLPSDYSQAGPDTIRNTRIKLSAENMKFTQEQIQALMYSSKAKQEELAKTTDTKDGRTKLAESKPSKIPNFLMNIAIADVLLGKTKLSFFSEVASGKNKIASKDLKMKLDKGSVTGKFISKISDGKISTNFDLKGRKLNLVSFNFLLPTFINSMKGSGTFNVAGKVETGSKEMTYLVKLDTDLRDGKLSKVKLNEFLQSYIDNIPVLSKKISKDDIKISEKFKRLKVKAELSHNYHKVSLFDFQGIGNNVVIKGDADVKVPKLKTKSIVTLTLTDSKGKLGKKLKREVGTSALPLRFDGIGYTLSPDYEYTAKRLAKTAVKTQGKKVLKKQAESAVDKLLKGKSQEKAKQLLKGLFK